MTELRDNGMTIRGHVLGSDHVARVQEKKAGFDETFQSLIADAALGQVRARQDRTA